MLAGILGGRAAEEIVFGDITTGASNDLEKVTEIARNMVQRWGMSEKLGPLVYGKKEELVFLGKELGEQRDYSEAVAQQIDGEVQRIVTEAHETALRVLTENRERLDRVAADLDGDRIAGSGRVREGMERRRAAEAGQFRRHAGRPAQAQQAGAGSADACGQQAQSRAAARVNDVSDRLRARRS